MLGGQFISYEKYKETYSVDTKSDIKIVKKLLLKDKLSKNYTK